MLYSTVIRDHFTIALIYDGSSFIVRVYDLAMDRVNDFRFRTYQSAFNSYLSMKTNLA